MDTDWDFIEEPEWRPELFVMNFRDKHGRVNRPPNSFFVFMKLNRPLLASQLPPKTDCRELNRLLASTWKRVPEKIKESYALYADRLADMHKEMYPSHDSSYLQRKKDNEEYQTQMNQEGMLEMDRLWEELGFITADADCEGNSAISNELREERLVPVFVKLALVQRLFPNQKFEFVRAEDFPVELLNVPVAGESSSFSSHDSFCDADITVEEANAMSSRNSPSTDKNSEAEYTKVSPQGSLSSGVRLELEEGSSLESPNWSSSSADITLAFSNENHSWTSMYEADLVSMSAQEIDAVFDDMFQKG